MYKREDDALAEREEANISTHRFSSIDVDRTIHFKDYYLCIYNQNIGHYDTHKNHDISTTVYELYNVSVEYIVYVRRASVYFEI